MLSWQRSLLPPETSTHQGRQGGARDNALAGYLAGTSVVSSAVATTLPLCACKAHSPHLPTAAHEDPP